MILALLQRCFHNESSGCLSVKRLYLSWQGCDNRPEGAAASSQWRGRRRGGGGGVCAALHYLMQKAKLAS